MRRTFISSYTAVGTTNLGVTTFTIPTLLKQGQGVFQGLDLGIEPGAIGPTATPPGPQAAGDDPPPQVDRRGGLNVILWGGYSTTVIDPSNPDEFWTFQSFADAQTQGDVDTWGVQATRVTVDYPAVSLAVSGPLPVSTTQSIGVLGDDISTGNGSATGEQPNWVTQLSTPATGSTTAEFTVPVGANEAAVGATTANLSAQGAEPGPVYRQPERHRRDDGRERRGRFGRRCADLGRD